MKLCPPDRPNWTLGGLGGSGVDLSSFWVVFGGVKGSGGESVEWGERAWMRQLGTEQDKSRLTVS